MCCCCSCRRLCCCGLTLAIIAGAIIATIVILFPDTNPPISTRASTVRLQRTDTTLTASISVVANVTNNNRYAVDLRSGDLQLSHKGNVFYRNQTALPPMTFPARQTTAYQFTIDMALTQTDDNAKALQSIVSTCTEQASFDIDIAATIRVSLRFLPFAYPIPITSRTTQSCQ